MTSKITAILMAFRHSTEHSLTEIARLAELPISTAHRLTSELTAWRVLERVEDGRYRVGLPLRMLGTHTWYSPTLHELGPQVMDDLSVATRTRVRLGILDDLEVAYIEKRPGDGLASTFAPHAVLPAHASGLGKALLAFAPARTVDRVVERGLKAYTPHTLTSPDRLRRALAVTRLTRVAVSRRELTNGDCAVAMPVFGAGGEVVAALELAVADLARELEPMKAALTVATGSLSRELATSSWNRRTPRPSGPSAQRDTST